MKRRRVSVVPDKSQTNLTSKSLLDSENNPDIDKNPTANQGLKKTNIWNLIETSNRFE